MEIIILYGNKEYVLQVNQKSQKLTIQVILQNFKITNLDNGKLGEDPHSIGFAEPKNMKLKLEKIH